MSTIGTTLWEPARIMREAAQRMSAEQKLAVAHALRELAWELKASAVRAEHPDWPEGQVEAQVRQVFLDALR